MRIYLDHNATAPLLPVARRAMEAAADVAGNPSSIHREGRAARAVVDRARAEVAAMLGGATDEVVFTSGGTEADVLGLVGLAELARGRGRPARLLLPGIEHPALLGTGKLLAARGFAVETVKVDPDGRIDLAALATQVAAPGAVLAFSVANHELGTRQDEAAVIELARRGGWLVHVDAVQAAGKLSLAPALTADTVAVSAHKLGGPKGVGALWIRRGLDLEPLWPAGHQERGRRGGTENLIGIAGFGAAAAAADPSRGETTSGLLERFEAGVLAIAGAEIRARQGPRLGNTSNVRFAGALGEAVVIALDLAGIAASTGAACSSGSVAPSPVLVALGLPTEEAREAVRFSFGPSNTVAEVDHVLEVLPAIVARARAHR